MSVTIRIPAPLRQLTGGRDTVTADGAGTVIEVIDGLQASYPGLKDRLCDDSGELRRFVNVYVNGEDVRFLSGLRTAIKPGDELSIVPAVAGG